MSKSGYIGLIIAAAAAGCVTGIFGAGGGMILVPCLSLLTPLDEQDIFPASLSVMLPICLVSLILSATYTSLPWSKALPYLIGGSLGGVIAGFVKKKIHPLCLHRILGLLILWGGLQKLCF